MSSVAVEMLVGLVHEGSNRSFPSRLKAAVIGGIQIGNSQFAHKRFDDGGCDGARHACKRVYVYHPIEPLFGILPCTGNAQAGFGSHVKREKIVSTGIGMGVAIPHAKLPSFDRFFLAVGLQKVKDGIDWDALDGAPVRLIFMIGGPANQQTDYLKILSIQKYPPAACLPHVFVSLYPAFRIGFHPTIHSLHGHRNKDGYTPHYPRPVLAFHDCPPDHYQQDRASFPSYSLRPV